MSRRSSFLILTATLLLIACTPEGDKQIILKCNHPRASSVYLIIDELAENVLIRYPGNMSSRLQVQESDALIIRALGFESRPDLWPVHINLPETDESLKDVIEIDRVRGELTWRLAGDQVTEPPPPPGDWWRIIDTQTWQCTPDEVKF